MQLGADLNQFLEPLVILALVASVPYAMLTLRAGAMRALAARSGFHYVGPAAPKWFGLPKIKPRLALALNFYPANEIRQVWNVIEGEQDGKRILIFDSVFGPFGWHTYEFCTFMACETDQNPFEKDANRERTLKSGQWRVLYRRWPILNGLALWTMTVQRLERHLIELREIGATD